MQSHNMSAATSYRFSTEKGRKETVRLNICKGRVCNWMHVFENERNNCISHQSLYVRLLLHDSFFLSASVECDFPFVLHTRNVYIIFFTVTFYLLCPHFINCKISTGTTWVCLYFDLPWIAFSLEASPDAAAAAGGTIGEAQDAPLKRKIQWNNPVFRLTWCLISAAHLSYLLNVWVQFNAVSHSSLWTFCQLSVSSRNVTRSKNNSWIAPLIQKSSRM